MMFIIERIRSYRGLDNGEHCENISIYLVGIFKFRNLYNIFLLLFMHFTKNKFSSVNIKRVDY